MNGKRIERMGKVRLLAALVLFGSLSVLGAQSLLDNPDFRRARELQQLAERALAEGEYDQATQYAEEARIHAVRAEESAARLLLKYRANGWRQQARNRVAETRAQGAEKSFAEGFARASAEAGRAESAYQAGEYEQSIGHARSALAALEGFVPVPQRVPVSTGPATAAAEPVYPRYYRVRLIPEDRDCLNKIAGYPFVYNDRTQWKGLYEANRRLLKQPDNPHLIFPDQVFEIPSIRGEKREGVYEPGRQYPAFPPGGR
jgi:nucleoid-associated protein YgaU